MNSRSKIDHAKRLPPRNRDIGRGRADGDTPVDVGLAVENSPFILFQLSAGEKPTVTHLSGNIARFGYAPEDFLAGRKAWDEFVHPDDAARIARETETLAARGETQAVLQHRIRAADGSIRWVERHQTTILDPANGIVAVQGFLTDITDRKLAEDRIDRLALFDSVTGLPNRHAFKERLNQEIARASGRGAKSFAVLVIDLDHFKDINDTLGHSVGDALLQALAAQLKAQIRGSDMLARLGGDEFAVLQTDLGDATGARIFAEKLLATLRRPTVIDGHEIRITATIGIDIHAGRKVEPDTMLRNADTALYRAKENGRNAWRLHTRSMDRELRERVTLADDLKRALERDELYLEFQPLVDGRDGRLRSLEALVRWGHPTRGTLLPSVFIPVAEQAGLILDIDRFVLRAACRQIEAWQKAGLSVPRVAVNLSALGFRAERLEADIDAALAEAGLAPAQLALEITETALMSAPDRQDAVLKRLRKKGVAIAIDDFGTGHSCLAYLSHFRPDWLKIPVPFISRIMIDERDRAIVRAIVNVAQATGIGVVAEGVETAEQNRCLLDFGCNVMQGYLFARPMAADAIVGLLKAEAEAKALAAKDAASRHGNALLTLMPASTLIQ